jgi:hypothetical protein
MIVGKVYRSGDPEPPPEVEALLDHKNEVWDRLPDGRFNCPGNEAHTWAEMSTYSPAFVAIPSYRKAVAADEAQHPEGRWKS